MEIRELQYFLEVARDENMTRAAERLHITQPTLSRTLRSLEEELGKKLFIRHSFKIELTEEGVLLRKRAEDVISMIHKIKSEFLSMDDITGGELYFGMAESYQIRFLAREIKKFKKIYPHLKYHITSGDTELVTEKLDKGLLDFAVLVEEPDSYKYEYIKLKDNDIFGLIMPDDAPLAKKDQIVFEDLIGLPLFISEQAWRNEIPQWCGKKISQLKVEGLFRLAYNASLFVKEGLGYLIAFDQLINTSKENGLTFRPLFPQLECPMYIIWKKNTMLSPIATRFLNTIIDDLGK